MHGVNGVPSCANTWLLDDILRKSWDYKGFVIADCAAVDHIWSVHKYARSSKQSLANSLNAGLDINNCNSNSKTISDMVEAGLIDESIVDRSVSRLFELRCTINKYQHY